MAKKKVKSSKKLLPAKEITVMSRAYGVHTRAARGSKTPVALNDVLKENVAKTALINSAAKRVHDLLKICGIHFKEAMLWQVMLSRMRKAISTDITDLLLTLTGMELNSRYPLSRFVYAGAPGVVWSKKKCVVTLQSSMSPRIKTNDTHYLYELYVLTLGKDVKHDGLVSGQTEWREKGSSAREIVFSFDLPHQVLHYVVCLHIMTGKEDKVTGTLASKGMNIISAG